MIALLLLSMIKYVDNHHLLVAVTLSQQGGMAPLVVRSQPGAAVATTHQGIVTALPASPPMGRGHQMVDRMRGHHLGGCGVVPL